MEFWWEFKTLIYISEDENSVYDQLIWKKSEIKVISRKMLVNYKY